MGNGGVEEKYEEKRNTSLFEGDGGIQQSWSIPLTSVMAPIFFTFCLGLSLLIDVCMLPLECFSAFPPAHSTPTLTVFLGTALKNKCTPTVCI